MWRYSIKIIEREINKKINKEINKEFNTDRKKYLKIITIAGSDSSAGAGLQADMKVMLSLGIYPMTVVTAVTAQNTLGVQQVFPLPASIVEAQLQSLLSDCGADLIKIGMLATGEIVEAVVKVLKTIPTLPTIPPIPIILDPVLCSSSGHLLLDSMGRDLFFKELWPLCFLVTPNLAEAALLSGIPDLIEDSSGKRMEEVSAQLLRTSGAQNILLKGGHLPGDWCADFLLGQEKARWYRSRRIPAHNNHGTGCTLASAIASFLVLKHDLPKAVEKAKHYLEECLIKGQEWTLGSGVGPLYPGSFQVHPS